MGIILYNNRFRCKLRQQRHKTIWAVQTKRNCHTQKRNHPEKYSNPSWNYLYQSDKQDKHTCYRSGYAHIEYPIKYFLQHNHHLLSISFRSSLISSSDKGSSSSKAENNALREPPKTRFTREEASTFCISF